MSWVLENFYVQLNILEKRDGHPNVCSPITKVVTGELLNHGHFCQKPFASWQDHVTILVSGLLVEVLSIIPWPRMLREWAFIIVSVCPQTPKFKGDGKTLSWKKPRFLMHHIKKYAHLLEILLNELISKILQKLWGLFLQKFPD